MKVLILSITAGQGHNSVANSLKIEFEKNNVECAVLDTYNYLNKLVGKTVSSGYIISVENAKHIYKTVYHRLEKRKKNAYRLSATRLTNMVFIRKMRRYIYGFDPDVIICTHVFAGILIDIIKQRYSTRAKTIGILTDFAFHPYWEEILHFDYIITPSEHINLQAMKKGFRKEQILPFGIPIDPKFAEALPPSEARERIGLEKDKRTVLLMSGSMGYGDITETVSAIDRIDIDFQIIAVCGNNTSVKEKLNTMQTEKKMIVFGYTNEISMLMDAADCIITKPGGLTTSESLAKLLPMILVNPIPGQEERNMQFLLNNGAAIAANDLMTVDEVLYGLFSSETRIDNIRNSMRELSKPNSTSKICEFACQLISKT